MLQRKATISSHGIDAGSSFLRMCCASCQAPAGRVYVSTPRHLDVLRDGFTFLTDDGVKSYALGSGEVRIEGGAGGSEPPAGPPARAALDGELTARVEGLETELLKAQNLLLLYNERLEALEAAQRSVGAP